MDFDQAKERAMGRLVEGVWSKDQLATDGAFVRPDAGFRNWITADGAAGPSGVAGFKAQSGRYHLYVSYACPWAHRTLIFRVLKGLEEHISVSVVDPDMLDNGWALTGGYPGTTGDDLFGMRYIHEVYAKADPAMSGRATVPVLWDKHQATIVSNESSEIIRMFNSAFNGITGNTQDYWPLAHRTEIEEVNDRVYHTLNNGVYKSGFATTQGAYDVAVSELFDTMEWLETRLSSKRYLMGEALTEADWRLFPTLVRFDMVYHLHFKCNRKRLVDYPNLWAYTRDLYQMPGIAGTVNMDHIVRHYHFSHESINPHRIIPINPVLDWDAPHGR
ncbi:MAG: putative glutathione S-transferase [Paracoccaceae bacterium]